jgi:hypothetical protein
MEATATDVLRRRVHVQQLDRPGPATEATVLDLGVQDTGPDGAAWALALRGVAPDAVDTVTAWTLRGAPHVYRRSEVAEVAAATAPFSEADAARRVFDAARPLRAAGIPVLEALGEIAREMRDIVGTPTVKGEMSTELTRRMADPYLRYCRPCDTIHLYEQPFRLAALRAGLELQPGTSPPVLQRIPGWRGPAATVPERLDPVRAVLHLLGPLTAKQVAGYLDAPVDDVVARWPEDAVPVTVQGEQRSLLEADVAALADPHDPSGVVRLLGPFDPFLQARDRELLVPDEARRKELWRTLGRPGAVLVGHEVRGTWRPRASGSRLRLLVDAWGQVPDLTEQAERLAAET